METPAENERRTARLLEPATDAARDREVARQTVRPRPDCPHCTPTAGDPND